MSPLSLFLYRSGRLFVIYHLAKSQYLTYNSEVGGMGLHTPMMWAKGYIKEI